MLKRGGRWTNLIILRGRRRIFDLLFNVRHSPIISNHIFGAATGHHTNLEQRLDEKKILFPVQSFTHPVSIIIIFYNLIDFIRKKKKKNCGKIIEKQKKTVCFAVSCTFFLLLFLSTTNASSIFRIDFRKFAIHSIDVSRNISSQFFSSILINYLLLFSLFNFFFLIHFIRPLIFFENTIRCDLWRRRKKK